MATARLSLAAGRAAQAVRIPALVTKSGPAPNRAAQATGGLVGEVEVVRSSSEREARSSDTARQASVGCVGDFLGDQHTRGAMEEPCSVSARWIRLEPDARGCLDEALEQAVPDRCWSVPS